MQTLLFGLITGILFGFLLQKGRAARYDRQVGAMLLTDMTIIKFMLSAILVGMAGIYLLHDLGLAKLSIKGTSLGANIVGGLIFGCGWALAGYCPGTAAAAIGEGSWDAVWAALGGLAGAAIYAEAYPFLQKTVLQWGSYGKITLPQLLGVNHWVVIIVLGVAYVLLFLFFEKKGL